MYRLGGDSARENEGHQMHKNFSSLLLRDHYRASQLTEHALIQWTDGPFPPFTPSQPIVTPPPVGSNPASSAAVAGMTANPMHGMGGVAAAGDSSMGVSPAAAVAAVPAMGAHDLQSQQQQAALMAQAYQQQQMAAHHHHGQY